MSDEKKNTVKEYSNGEIAVVWKPDLCIHSANCVRGLPEVFDNRRRPWIDIGGASTERIIDQVKKCPSGALSFYHHEDAPSAAAPAANVAIEVKANGPLLVEGTVSIRHADGSEEMRTGKFALCRCGASARKPFCDGSHRRVDFQG